MPVEPLATALRRGTLTSAAEFLTAAAVGAALILATRASGSGRPVAEASLLLLLTLGAVAWAGLSAVVLEGPANRRRLRDAQPLPADARLGSSAGVRPRWLLIAGMSAAVLVLDLLGGDEGALLLYPALLVAMVLGRLLYDLVLHTAAVARSEAERGDTVFVAGRDQPLLRGRLKHAPGGDL